MIDNFLDDNMVTRRRTRLYKTRDATTIPNPLIGDDYIPKDSTVIHLTPIRRIKGGKNSSHTTQLRCRKCSRKTKNQCRECEPTYEILSGRNGRYLFVKYSEKGHE